MSDEQDERRARELALLADALPEVAPQPDLRRRLLTSLHGEQRFAPFVAEVADAFGLPRDALHDAFARIGEPTAWITIPRGWQLLTTPALERAHVQIARLPPAVEIPAHMHRERELTYVLDGLLIEDDVQHHAAGALLVMAPGTTHAIRTGEHGCLVVFSPGPEPNPSAKDAETSGADFLER